MIIFDKIAVSQRWEIKIPPKFYPTFCNICPVRVKNFINFQFIEVPKTGLAKWPAIRGSHCIYVFLKPPVTQKHKNRAC